MRADKILFTLAIAIVVIFIIGGVIGQKNYNDPEVVAEREKEEKLKKGRTDRLYDSISDYTLLSKIEDNWEKLDLDSLINEVEGKIDDGDRDYQPRKTRRIKNKGDKFEVERNFIKKGEEYIIEAELYYITRQHYKVGINNRYKNHYIPIAIIYFDVDTDKNDYGWKISNVRLAKNSIKSLVE